MTRSMAWVLAATVAVATAFGCHRGPSGAVGGGPPSTSSSGGFGSRSGNNGFGTSSSDSSYGGAGFRGRSGVVRW